MKDSAVRRSAVRGCAVRGVQEGCAVKVVCSEVLTMRILYSGLAARDS